MRCVTLHHPFNEDCAGEARHEQFHLRIALLRAGYTPAPCHSGRPVVIPHGEVPESSILAWQNLNAPETGIYNQTTGEVTIVDAVPLTEAELAVQAEAQERARAEAHGAAERAERRSYKEAKRRAKGAPVRSKWLEEHHQDRDKVWEKFQPPMSRAKWYRIGKPTPEIGCGGSPNPAPRVRSTLTPTINACVKNTGELE